MSKPATLHRFVPARLRLGLLAGAALLAAGCAVGPDYQPPPAGQLPAGFVAAGAGQPGTGGQELGRFWQGFSDPVLDGLVDTALAANTDVRIAQARLQEARALLLGARAELLPAFGIDAGAGRGVTPLPQRPGTSRSERTGNAFDAGVVMNWELDLFGGARRAGESAAAQVAASEAGVGAAQVAVLAEVVRNYVLLRGLQQRHAVADSSLENQRQALRLTELRQDAGRGTQLDVARARSLVASTEAALPALQAQIEQATFRIARLTGLAPAQAVQRLSAAAALPTLPVTDLGALPAGTPEALLRRRPDIVQAERQLAAASADIGVATADLFPRISLSGLLGFNNSRVSNLTDSNARVYSAGAGIAWTFLDFGRIRSRISASEARNEGALATYEQTVLLALEETETAFSRFNRTAQQGDRLEVAARSAEEAARLSRIRFEAGATDFLAVLDAERELLSVRDQLAQARSGTATALVDVYRALGGGWR
ncbi:efflux transporter outer membrane subunit [Ramlibacter tataouinensis]|uniref:Candidate outer membrane transporter n=1 Tax=Ramlibacter tataouinensis (strain ATCC BAA-407 / DSM 14655 / LMG 21543 / TTB310) TaxID=365046 RepID=F5Y077_RAMTT|nr:efflux transporter outer membrane subunit [Ramlibacter tataouinensis]AEG94626.1 Candidate outer membrane transporter [Ramlibacter tataouinensis TTB310]